VVDVDGCLLFCCAMQSGRSLPTFQRCQLLHREDVELPLSVSRHVLPFWKSKVRYCVPVFKIQFNSIVPSTSGSFK
jgi:hypothetical protein